jgi:hypothetical protein
MQYAGLQGHGEQVLNSKCRCKSDLQRDKPEAVPTSRPEVQKTLPNVSGSDMRGHVEVAYDIALKSESVFTRALFISS